MKQLKHSWAIGLLFLLIGCSPVKTGVENQHQIIAFSNRHFGQGGHRTILISAPHAVVAYQTNQMWYVTKPYERGAFAKNSWTTAPGDMLFPLLIRSIQASGYFYAVTSSPYSEVTDYRLDTQLLKLEQNFLTKPSRLLFSAKVVLSRSSQDKPIASRIFNIAIPCTSDSPQGGAQAANKASLWFTAEVVRFIIRHV